MRHRCDGGVAVHAGCAVAWGLVGICSSGCRTCSCSTATILACCRIAQFSAFIFLLHRRKRLACLLLRLSRRVGGLLSMVCCFEFVILLNRCSPMCVVRSV